jgi:CRP/FNR family transcriptional activator FtrB
VLQMGSRSSSSTAISRKRPGCLPWAPVTVGNTYARMRIDGAATPAEAIKSMNSMCGIGKTVFPAAANAGDHSDIPLFAKLPFASRERVLSGAHIERVAVNTTLFCEGDEPTQFHVVLRGLIDVSRTHRERRCTVLLMTVGDSFMPAAALSDEPYLVSARTLTPSRILVIDAAVVRDEVDRTPEFARAIARLVSGQWRMALRIILDLKCRSASERLAAFLLRLHDAHLPGAVAEIPFAKHQLAARIGMQPETLSRTLQVLADNGLRVRGREVIVVDRAKVEGFCGPDPYPKQGEADLGVNAL